MGPLGSISGESAGGVMGFDNDGNVVLHNRAYRRRKIQLEIDPKHLPKQKPRKKKNKKNYLNKRKK